jgi:AP-3 complex subunit mu
MLDEGHPLTMETNMLKDIVLPPTLVRKLLAAAGVSGLVTGPRIDVLRRCANIYRNPNSSLSPTNPPYSAPIPWRRPNVRYSNNEIYFDFEERIDAIVDKWVRLLRCDPTESDFVYLRRGKALSIDVWGRVNCNAKLTGRYR